MQERDAFLLRTDPRGLVDETDTGRPASLERGIQVLDRKAQVVDPGASFLDEPRNRRVGYLGFEELDERLTGREAGDAGAVGVVERDLRHLEDVAVERQDLIESADRNADMGEARSSTGVWHAHG